MKCTAVEWPNEAMSPNQRNKSKPRRPSVLGFWLCSCLLLLARRSSKLSKAFEWPKCERRFLSSLSLIHSFIFILFVLFCFHLRRMIGLHGSFNEKQRFNTIQSCCSCCFLSLPLRWFVFYSLRQTSRHRFVSFVLRPSAIRRLDMIHLLHRTEATTLKMKTR